MRRIAISNCKGGCGKTTTAINLTAELANLGHRVLLIDMDPQSAASRSLGVRDPDLSIYDVLVEGIPIQDCIQHLDFNDKIHFDIAPADRRILSAAVVKLNDLIGREFILQNRSQNLDGYDYVIIDTSPSLDVLMTNSLVASKEVIIPVQSQYLPLDGMKMFIDLIDMIHENLKMEIRKRYVITLHRPWYKICQEAEEIVRNTYPNETLKTVIKDNVKLMEAPSHGVPVRLHDPDSAGCKAYAQLAKEVGELHE